MPLSSQKLKIHKWEPRGPLDRSPLPVLFEGMVDLPEEHDPARAAAAARAKSLVPRVRRVHGCAALAGGGFSVIVVQE